MYMHDSWCTILMPRMQERWENERAVMDASKQAGESQTDEALLAAELERLSAADIVLVPYPVLSREVLAAHSEERLPGQGLNSILISAASIFPGVWLRRCSMTRQSGAARQLLHAKSAFAVSSTGVLQGVTITSPPKLLENRQRLLPCLGASGVSPNL